MLSKINFFGGMKEKVYKVGKHVVNICDPKVGPAVWRLQSSKLLIRVDGRSLKDLYTSGGFKARVSKQNVLDLRHTDIEQYQRYNINPFGYGACTSFPHLQKFISGNKSHTDTAWIHTFYGEATSLNLLKLDQGLELAPEDHEEEHMVVKDVPFEQILASTCPAYREKFLDGKLVPNAMRDFNDLLPKSMRHSDLNSDAHILTWLLANNAEEIFAGVCQTLYPGKSEDMLMRMFDGDKRLVSAVQYFLNQVQQSAITPKF